MCGGRGSAGILPATGFPGLSPGGMTEAPLVTGCFPSSSLKPGRSGTGRARHAPASTCNRRATPRFCPTYLAARSLFQKLFSRLGFRGKPWFVPYCTLTHARRFVSEVFDVADLLVTQPRMGRMVPGASPGPRPRALHLQLPGLLRDPGGGPPRPGSDPWKAPAGVGRRAIRSALRGKPADPDRDPQDQAGEALPGCPLIFLVAKLQLGNATGRSSASRGSGSGASLPGESRASRQPAEL